MPLALIPFLHELPGVAHVPSSNIPFLLTACFACFKQPLLLLFLALHLIFFYTDSCLRLCGFAIHRHFPLLNNV